MAEAPTGEDKTGSVSEPDEQRGEARNTEWSLFGDPLGLAVFLGALALAGATWQVGVFITDTYAVANGLVNVGEGHLTIERIRYSLTLDSQPGLHVVDGELYARNYGQAVLAVPVYYALEALTTVARLELLIAAGWSLLVLAACRQAGIVLGRRQGFQVGGSLLALGLFGAGVPLATTLDPEATGLVALQVFALLASAVTALAVYRLVRLRESRRLAAVAGGAAVVATPLWFWAAVPKRHTLGAAAVAVLLFWFASSRRPGPRASLGPVGVRKDLALRAGAYVLAGLVAWVHAFEGVLLLGTLAAADLATASAASRRALVAVAVGVSVGLAPFVATNMLVTGNPAEPPRLAESFHSDDPDIRIGPEGRVSTADGADGSSGGDGADGSSGSSAGTLDGGGGESGATGQGGDSTGTAESGPVTGALADRVRSSSVAEYAGRALAEANAAPARLYHTYVRSGRFEEFGDTDVNAEEAVDLSLAESFPLVGALAGWLVGGLLGAVRSAGRARRHGPARRSDGGTGGAVGRRLATVGTWFGGLPRRVREADPGRQTAGFALALVAGYATLYFPFLPLHSQLTVRYLLPVAPALVWLLVCVPAVRRSVARSGRSLAAAYLGALVVGAAAAAVAFPVLDPAVGEAMQLHGLANLGVCVALVAATAGARAGFIADTRVPAAALGVAGAATTLLVVRMQLVYFEYGSYAAPVVRAAADLVGGA